MTPTLETAKSFSLDHNDFACALYQQLLRQPGNLFLSPYSIRTALGMTYAGAKGETATQMSKALRFATQDETPHAAFARFAQKLDAAGGEYEMVVANSLWGQEGIPLQREFVDLIGLYYGGGLKVVDFRQNAEAAREAINQWVEDKTKEKIQELIPSGALNAETRLVLVNAVYFKGTWFAPFPKADTREQPFHVEGGRTVQAPLMYQKTEVRYLHADHFQVVDLDYQGGDLSMLVLLPDKRDGLRDLETELTGRLLRDCIANMSETEVEVFLPRFRMTWGAFDLKPEMIALGMPLAFTRFSADFSGINGVEPPHEDSLFIGNVFHKAFVDVNEEGTEAAAATGMGLTMAMSLPPKPPVFRADHPFLFAIYDRRSETILFLGRMADPTVGR
jgi:serpin B